MKQTVIFEFNRSMESYPALADIMVSMGQKAGAGAGEVLRTGENT